MGRLKLPEPDKPRQEKTTARKMEPLSPGDTIEYGLTVEVSTTPGQKAWVKFGTTSSVREGESTHQARSRIADFVNDEIDNRIEDLSD